MTVANHSPGGSPGIGTGVLARWARGVAEATSARPPLRPSPVPPQPDRRPGCVPDTRGDMAGVHRLLLENAQQVVLVCAHGERFLARDALRSLAVLEGASLVVGA